MILHCISHGKAEYREGKTPQEKKNPVHLIYYVLTSFGSDEWRGSIGITSRQSGVISRLLYNVLHLQQRAGYIWVTIAVWNTRLVRIETQVTWTHVSGVRYALYVHICTVKILSENCQYLPWLCTLPCIHVYTCRCRNPHIHVCNYTSNVQVHHSLIYTVYTYIWELWTSLDSNSLTRYIVHFLTHKVIIKTLVRWKVHPVLPYSKVPLSHNSSTVAQRLQHLSNGSLLQWKTYIVWWVTTCTLSTYMYDMPNAVQGTRLSMTEG